MRGEARDCQVGTLYFLTWWNSSADAIPEPKVSFVRGGRVKVTELERARRTCRVDLADVQDGVEGDLDCRERV